MISERGRQRAELFSKRQPESLAHPEILQLTNTAVTAALSSARITSSFSRGVTPETLHVEYKADETPKTIADVEGDFAIVNTIRASRPQDNIHIEESGYHKGLTDLSRRDDEGRLTWYADSLDGTRPFTEGKDVSTVGVMVSDAEGNYLASAVVHPFRKQIAYAARGMGAYMVDLTDEFEMQGEPKKLRVSQKGELAGSTVAIDSLYTPANSDRKLGFLDQLQQIAFANGKGMLSQDEYGSNIGYEFDVARGATLFGLTDSVGGPWDWRVGEALIVEAEGKMIDPLTGERPTDASTVVVYGNDALVDQLLPLAQKWYNGYEGFNKNGGKKGNTSDR